MNKRVIWTAVHFLAAGYAAAILIFILVQLLRAGDLFVNSVPHRVSTVETLFLIVMAGLWFASSARAGFKE